MREEEKKTQREENEEERKRRDTLRGNEEERDGGRDESAKDYVSPRSLWEWGVPRGAWQGGGRINIGFAINNTTRWNFLPPDFTFSSVVYAVLRWTVSAYLPFHGIHTLAGISFFVVIVVGVVALEYGGMSGFSCVSLLLFLCFFVVLITTMDLFTCMLVSCCLCLHY